MDPAEGGRGSDGLPRRSVPVTCPFLGGCKRRQFLGAEGSEVQWKLCMGVGLCVPPAHCSRITDGGRNISELFYAFFFFFFFPSCVTAQTQHF